MGQGSRRYFRKCVPYLMHALHLPEAKPTSCSVIIMDTLSLPSHLGLFLPLQVSR